MKEQEYWVLAYYIFAPIEDPHLEVTKHKKFFSERDAKGRIYISEQGINGQMSAAAKDAQAYIDWIHSDPRFAQMPVKIHYAETNVFPRMTVKYREQLVALDAEVDMNLTGEHLSPSQWREMLESEERPLLLDVRNQYESAIGRFEGAVQPPLETFREFPAYAERLSQEVDTEKPVMMYCTGGIRCEPYSALLRQAGFHKVYQLEGGVINYGLKEGQANWEGKLFVFDERMAVPISDNESPSTVGACHHCGVSGDTQYNCANADCNELFISCPSCLETHRGCCSKGCEEAPRVRPERYREGSRPFRRLSSYTDTVE